MWLNKAVLLLLGVATARAQIPSLGWCPDYQAMPDFNMNRFLGLWHEAERYFTVTEVGSRCVTTDYEKMPDGRVWVSNEIRNSFTGVKRVLDGQLQVVGRDGEGKISVKYTSLPVPYDTQYSILDTDYDSYAVVWSCSGIGPVHTQNAWIMTRDRLAPGLTMQKAYGVLDRYKISRAFFVKTNQDDCAVQPPPIEAIDPTPSTEVKKDPAKGKDVEGGEVVAEVPAEKSVAPEVPAQQVEEQPQVKGPVPVGELIRSISEQQNSIAGDLHEEAPQAEKAAAPAQESKPQEDQQPQPSQNEEHQEEQIQSKSVVPDVVIEDQKQVVSEVVHPAEVAAHEEVPQVDQPAPQVKSDKVIV